MHIGTVVLFQPGDVIFKQGDPGDCMYFIREGRAQVEKAQCMGGEVKVVAILQSGDPIGEMALVLLGGRRTATVRAMNSVVAERTSREGFGAMLHATPPTLQEIVRVLVRRLADTTELAVAKS